MYRKGHVLVLVLLLVVTASLWSQKSSERLAREKGVEAEGLWEKGSLSESAQACEEAITLFQKAVAEDEVPNDTALISHWLTIAFDCYVKTSKLEDALRVLNSMIDLDKENIMLYDQKALLQKKLERFDDAIATYTYIDSVEPGYKNCKKIASIYKDREDWENALIWYYKSYDLRQDSNTINDIAVINLTLGRNEAAIQAYKDYLATEPAQAAKIRTYKNLGKLYEDLGQIATGLEYYEKSNKLRFDNDITLLLISRYYDLERYDDCQRNITLYLKNKPDAAAALYYRAMINYNNGNLLGARSDFEKIQTNPTYGSIAKGYIESINSQ
ncbi:MAG: tetratricopeptide repeat protein [Candidatus Cloacimonetes bacterium]|nr:tetratricopeptide repeat protein [Candidatus Cloacimonadota bacterium]